MNTITCLEQLGIGMTFDVATLKGHVRRLAEEHPDNVYNKPDGIGPCVYGSGTCTDGSVGCIVGQGLKAMGVDPVALDEYVGEEPSGIDDILDDAGLARDPWLSDVQAAQDEGRTWARAVRYADDRK